MYPPHVSSGPYAALWGLHKTKHWGGKQATLESGVFIYLCTWPRHVWCVGFGFPQTTSLGEGYLGEIPLRPTLASSGRWSVLGCLEQLTPPLSSSLHPRQHVVHSCPQTCFSLKGSWFCIFTRGLILKFFIYRSVIKMQYYKLLLERLLNSVFFFSLSKIQHLPPLHSFHHDTFKLSSNSLCHLHCFLSSSSTPTETEIMNFFNVLPSTSGYAHCADCSLFPRRVPAFSWQEDKMQRSLPLAGLGIVDQLGRREVVWLDCGRKVPI